MGAFICQISDRDWPIAWKFGIYGNRLNKPNTNQPLRNQDRLSIIRDLIGLAEGDFIFFHVIRSGVESTIHGVFRARTKAFFDETKIWDDANDFFPHRFLFKPDDQFMDICDYDYSIKVSEFYAKIEQRRIWSQATLENERNIERRAVRKIATDDANEIIKLLVRGFSKNQKKSNFNLIEKPSHIPELIEKINSIGSIENAIKATTMYELREQTDFVKSIFGNVLDFMNEVFIAPTTRKLLDILIISKTNIGRCYFIVEAKTDLFRTGDLTQLLGYMDLFAQREIFKLAQDSIAGCTISRRIEEGVLAFVSLYNDLGVFGHINLISYFPEDEGKSARFEEIHSDTVRPVWAEHQLTRVENQLSYENISDEVVLTLPLFEVLPNVILEVFDKTELDQNKTYFLQMSLGQKKACVGYILLHCLNIPLSWDHFKEFALVLKDFVQKNTNGDYMDVRPIIFAPQIETKVNHFIRLYNLYHKRKPIEIFLF